MRTKGRLTLLFAASLCAVTAGASEIQPIAIVPAPDVIPGPQAMAGKSRVESESETWITAGTNPTFLLQFADVMDGTGSGFDDPDLGPARQAIAIAAFERTSIILAGEPGTARVRIDSRSPYFDGNVLAVGVPYFQCSDGFRKPIIFEALRNDVHVHEIEGELGVDFTLPLNADLDAPHVGQYDLFTVIFHEIAHILGFVGFTVGADGLPPDCGGARMLPTLARFALDGDGAPLWVERHGEIRFDGLPGDLPGAGQPLRISLPFDPQPQLHLASGNLAVSGHWLPEDFANRTGVLMLQEPIPSGVMRRNMTPETKAVLAGALEFTVGEEPRGLTGSWFDPASGGQGFSLHFIDRNRFVVYFFGFNDARERLWMIGVHDGDMTLGQDLSVPLFEATGGRFNDFDPGAVSETPWGTLEIRFHDCLNARATLTGLDGYQDMNLQRLAGVDQLECY